MIGRIGLAAAGATTMWAGAASAQMAAGAPPPRPIVVGVMAMPATRTEAMATVRKHFATLDRNGDGVVTRDELAAAVPAGKAGDAAPPGGGSMRGRMMAAMFDRADADHDGRVTRTEAERNALERFDRVDTDHDGRLGDAERAAVRPPRPMIYMRQRGDTPKPSPQ